MNLDRDWSRPSGSLMFVIAASLMNLCMVPFALSRRPLFALLAIVASGGAVAGGVIVKSHPTNGIALLWAALGIELATGLAGIFSIGLINILAAVMVLMAISAAPNPNGKSWFGLKFILPEIVTFVVTLSLIFR